MTLARLHLVVLRVADLERAAAFYRMVGFVFVRHAHGSGPEHYACEQGGMVFELYPATPEQPVTPSTRVGFIVAKVDDVVISAAAIEGAKVISAAKDSEWGRRAVLADPDGHRVEIVEER